MQRGEAGDGTRTCAPARPHGRAWFRDPTKNRCRFSLRHPAGAHLVDHDVTGRGGPPQHDGLGILERFGASAVQVRQRLLLGRVQHAQAVKDVVRGLQGWGAGEAEGRRLGRVLFTVLSPSRSGMPKRVLHRAEFRGADRARRSGPTCLFPLAVPRRPPSTL